MFDEKRWVKTAVTSSRPLKYSGCQANKTGNPGEALAESVQVSGGTSLGSAGEGPQETRLNRDRET